MKRTGRTLAALAGISYAGVCLAQEADSVQAEIVKGAPFTANVVTASTQVLADGNRIARNSTALLARDTEGRTRREQILAGAGNPPDQPTGASVVFIQDPVAKISFVLETRSRSALRIVTMKPQLTTSREGATNVKTESLGTQLIEGVEAEGTRVTRTTSANEEDNEQPFGVVLETWYSPEIETVVMSRSIDPRLGETVLRLTDIQLREPDHSLFEVPPGYTVVESQSSQQ